MFQEAVRANSSPTNNKGRLRAVSKPYVTIYGYARVSTDGQSVDTQVRQLRAAGAGKVFREVAIGAKTDRPQLRRLLSEVAVGDVVMVTRLDRLARSTRDLLSMLAAITEKKAGFRSLRRSSRSSPASSAWRRHARLLRAPRSRQRKSWTASPIWSRSPSLLW
jgi:DNA invertase Pin-like site-specific DNA recombinase